MDGQNASKAPSAQIFRDSICIRTQSSVSYTAPVLSDSIEQTPQVSFIYVSNSVSSRELADQPVPDDHSIRHRYRRAGLPLVLRPKLVPGLLVCHVFPLLRDEHHVGLSPIV